MCVLDFGEVFVEERLIVRWWCVQNIGPGGGNLVEDVFWVSDD